MTVIVLVCGVVAESDTVTIAEAATGTAGAAVFNNAIESEVLETLALISVNAVNGVIDKTLYGAVPPEITIDLLIGAASVAKKSAVAAETARGTTGGTKAGIVTPTEEFIPPIDAVIETKLIDPTC